jgi:5-methylcytosine-specific restriction endonuclease McrA
VKPKRRSFNPDGSQGRSNWARYTAKYPERQALYKSNAWRWARLQQLRREPNCRICGEKAIAVDHIIPISQGGADLDANNLQSLCRRHHNTNDGRGPCGREAGGAATSAAVSRKEKADENP